MSAASRTDSVRQLIPGKRRMVDAQQPAAIPWAMAVVSRSCGRSGICILRSTDSRGEPLELRAKPADGLLLVPEPEDQVLCVKAGSQWLIAQVLVRGSEAPMQFSSKRDIQWLAPRISFSALKELELLSAARLTCYGVDMVLGASRTLVQQAKHMIQHAGDFALTARGLLRLSGRQQVITAQEDVRVDGKRISMG